METEPGQQRHCDRAHATCRTCDDHRPILGCEAMLFECQHGEHRGEAGGSHRHGFARRHPARQTNQPVAIHPYFFGVSAEMGLTQTPAGRDDLVARLPVRMRGLKDGAGKIDACDHRKTSYHGRFAGDGQTVLVVHGRPLDRDRDVAVHQISFVELREGGRRAFFRLVDPDCLEARHTTLPRFSGRLMPSLKALQPIANPVLSGRRRQGSDAMRSQNNWPAHLAKTAENCYICFARYEDKYP